MTQPDFTESDLGAIERERDLPPDEPYPARRVVTVACSIGKHKRCSGEAVEPDEDVAYPCECPCHDVT